MARYRRDILGSEEKVRWKLCQQISSKGLEAEGYQRIWVYNYMNHGAKREVKSLNWRSWWRNHKISNWSLDLADICSTEQRIKQYLKKDKKNYYDKITGVYCLKTSWINLNSLTFKVFDFYKNKDNKIRVSCWFL